MAIVGNHNVIRKAAGTFATSGINVVPNGSALVDFVQAVLVSSATAGNRQLALEIFDGTNVLFRVSAGIVQAASVTRRYTFMTGVVREAAFVATDEVSIPIPSGLRLYTGQTLRLVDRANIDAAADTVAVSYGYFTD